MKFLVNVDRGVTHEDLGQPVGDDKSPGHRVRDGGFGPIVENHFAHGETVEADESTAAVKDLVDHGYLVREVSKAPVETFVTPKQDPDSFFRK